MFAHFNRIPEINHDEIEGWDDQETLEEIYNPFHKDNKKIPC